MALGHHVEALFRARFPGEGSRREAPGVQEFISKAIEKIQEGRVLQGDRPLSRGAAHCLVEGKGLRVCINIPGLNGAASQERFWPSRAGCYEGPPHSYVRMPFGLPSVASAYQRNMRRVLAAQEARYHAVLEEMETVFREPPEPPEPPEAQGPGGS